MSEALSAAADGSGLLQVMAAHSPLSALLAEEAGFDGVWASGFEISALHGVPDAGLVSEGERLEITRAMAARTRIPVIADLDTGFGDAVNLVHAVRRYEAAGVAAIVVEDKVHPKVTSLAPGLRQQLVSIECFQGKIAAACAARRNRGLLVIARTEALIAGLGAAEAHRRGAAYEAAGADMILVHSSQPSGGEVEAFARDWKGAARLVVIPTAYPSMTLERARRCGTIGMVIHGNHAVRACVSAMREVFAEIRRSGGTASVEGRIAGLDDIFQLQGMAELRDIEARFLR